MVGVNRTRTYETTFILKPHLSEEEVDKEKDKIIKILEDENCQILEVDFMGKLTLAYEIEKLKEGYYISIIFKGESKVVKELERQLRISDNVIRFLTIQRKYEVKEKEKSNVLQ